MLVYENAGYMDLRVLTTFGVNVKNDAVTAIGEFGTGLKYSIATLLRNDQTVTLYIKDDIFDFYTEPEEIRGTTFMMVYMAQRNAPNLDPIKLGFTTELGAHWEVWQAVREIYSNMLDEPNPQYTRFDTDNEPKSSYCEGTAFTLRGDLVEEVADNWHLHFTDPDQEYKWKFGNVFEATYGQEGGGTVFKQGISAYSPSKPAKLLYNFHMKLTLTEDRTIADPWNLMWKIANYIHSEAPIDFLIEFIDGTKDNWEAEIRLDKDEFTEGQKQRLVSAVQLIEGKHKDAHPDAISIYRSFTTTKTYETVSSEGELTKLDAAIQILEELSVRIKPKEVKFTDSLDGYSYIDFDKGVVAFDYTLLDQDLYVIAMELLTVGLCVKHELNPNNYILPQLMFEHLHKCVAGEASIDEIRIELILESVSEVSAEIEVE